MHAASLMPGTYCGMDMPDPWMMASNLALVGNGKIRAGFLLTQQVLQPALSGAPVPGRRCNWPI
jgi:hypothetical protein